MQLTFLFFFHKYFYTFVHVFIVCIYYWQFIYNKKKKWTDVVMLWCSFKFLPELAEDTSGWLVTDDGLHVKNMYSSQSSSKRLNKSSLKDSLENIQAVTK